MAAPDESRLTLEFPAPVGETQRRTLEVTCAEQGVRCSWTGDRAADITGPALAVVEIGTRHLRALQELSRLLAMARLVADMAPTAATVAEA